MTERRKIPTLSSETWAAGDTNIIKRLEYTTEKCMMWWICNATVRTGPPSDELKSRLEIENIN